jgi:membrane protease YdiL (CAAX protease family)
MKIINNQLNKRNLTVYIILTYVLFWILLGITGLTIYLKAPTAIQDIMTNVCAWAPTFAVLILFRKLYPDLSFKTYFQHQFKNKIHFSSFLYVLLIQGGIITFAIASVMVINKTPFSSLQFIKGSELLPKLLITVTGGAMGEELGWRGYLLNNFQAKHTPFVSSLFVGFIWGIWHLPLWLLMSGYSGFDLIVYILLFMVNIILISILITYFYNKEKNILIAMWIHFLFNFSLIIVQTDISQLFAFISIFTGIPVMALLIFKRNHFFKKINQGLLGYT